MKQLLKVFALAVVICVANILCGTVSNVHYEKCQEYQAEDETLGGDIKESVVTVKILGNTLEGTIISPDTILVITDVPNQEMTVHSFKVYLNDGHNDCFFPENFFIHDRFIVLKMSELIMKRYPRRRACLQIEFPKFSELHVINNLTLIALGICVKRDNLSNNICDFNHIFPYRPTPNNSLVLYIKQSKTIIVGNYFEDDDDSAKVKLIDEENIKWIESVTWNNTIRVEQCGQVKLPLTPFITYGMPTRPGEFPWHAAIFYENNYICGGTIINTRAIVTAAQCFKDGQGNKPAKSFTIVVGLYNLVNRDDQSQVLHVQSIITHENYNVASYSFSDNNIAVLRVVENIVYSNFVQPICMQSTVQPNGDEGIVPGWGKDELGNFREILQKGSIGIHQTEKCGRVGEGPYFRPYLSEGNICVRKRNGTNICTGDQGGGLVAIVNDRWILLGIASRGELDYWTPECRNLNLSVFTNATFFYNWIVDKSS